MYFIICTYVIVRFMLSIVYSFRFICRLAAFGTINWPSPIIVICLQFLRVPGSDRPVAIRVPIVLFALCVYCYRFML